MKIGDVVKWSSQAGGYMKSKQGVIVEVVPNLQSPKTKMSGVSGLSRRHESYVVHVGSALGKKNYYWPVVSGLKLVPQEVSVAELDEQLSLYDRDKYKKHLDGDAESSLNTPVSFADMTIASNGGGAE